MPDGLAFLDIPMPFFVKLFLFYLFLFQCIFREWKDFILSEIHYEDTKYYPSEKLENFSYYKLLLFAFPYVNRSYCNS